MVFRKRALKPGSGIGYHEQKEDEIYYVISGRGVMTIDGKSFDVTPGTAVLTRPGSSHGLEAGGQRRPRHPDQLRATDRGNLRCHTAILSSSPSPPRPGSPVKDRRRSIFAAIERARVLARRRRYLREQPVTITASRSPRSAGGLHDFFSEGDYWWPDPDNPDGPYIQRDGMTNPDNFVEHRQALMRLRVQVPALAAAWMLTRRTQLRGARRPATCAPGSSTRRRA